MTGHDSSRVSPFGHPWITARLPTPQGLSQAPTSFIGSRCQGIHHAPFIACLTHQQNNHYKVLASTIQISSNKPTPRTTPRRSAAVAGCRVTNSQGTEPVPRGSDVSEPQQCATSCRPDPSPCARQRTRPRRRSARTTGMSMVPLVNTTKLPRHERPRSGVSAP